MPRLTDQKILDDVLHTRISKELKHLFAKIVEEKGLVSVSNVTLGLIENWVENNPLKKEKK